MSDFIVRDSGKRQEFDSGMVRDTSDGKLRYGRVLDGPMFDRWAAHLQKGAAKYPDVAPGVANWTLASGPAELQRFKESALTHFLQWYRGETDEDHAAAVFFNINGKEHVEAQVLEPAEYPASPAVEVSDHHGHAGYVPALKIGAR